MEMNNPSVESHVAQKNRRHKLRFQQISGDLNHHHHHHHHQQDHDPHFLYNNPNVLPSIARNHNNPQLLLPSCYLSHDHQDSSNPERMNMMSSNDGVYGNLASYTQDCSSNWRTVVSSQQEAAGDHWNNAVSYSNAVPMNIDQRSISSSYGYHQETHNFNPSPFYHNNLQQDHVTLALPPHSKNHSGINPSIPCWMNNSDEQENNNTQGGLSLSLSSVPQLKDDQSGFKSDLLPNSDPKSLMGIAAFGHRNTGPLGPFTGYATILKNSKYIKPAQELLNVSCEVGYHTSCHDAYSHKILEEEISMASNSPVGSYGESDEHVSGRIGSGAESIRPGFHRKKAKLLYMQEEVCKRYKQYLQQMQMVISSFETVAGLSGATPYVCLALKAVSRHFHHVKNVISEQLSQMRKAVGEGLCSSSNVSKTFDANATSNSRQKSGGGGGSAGFFVPQQPVWRPQRGLPERAIAVLKTWLFDHFLHPYPSDADKHMLATQTGLTRNQVSNWFINARVRIWKPMVEEIHTLETKNLAEANSSHPQSDGDPNWNMDMNSMSNTQPPECSRNPGTVNVNLACVDEPHDHEKQARVEYQNNIPLSGMDRIMSIMPYPRATFDATGLGPVSLTLGLRQNAEHVQQLQQHFGGQLIHDFVG